MLMTRYVEQRATQQTQIVRPNLRPNLGIHFYAGIPLHIGMWAEIWAATCFRTFSVAIVASIQTSLVRLWFLVCGMPRW